MNLSLAELRRLLTGNPDLAARNVEALRSIAGSPLSADVRALNPDTAPLLTKPLDSADELYALIRILAPDLFPLFIREYKFDRWRIDLAIPSSLLAVECNGGRWQPGGGKHSTERDRKKIRMLTLAGWKVLEYSTELIHNDPDSIITEIRHALAQSP